MEHENTTGSTPPEPQDAKPSGPERHANTGMALIAYILFFVPLLTDAKNDPYVKYHVKQGLTLFLAWLALSIVGMVPPIIFLAPLLHVAMFVLMIIGMLNAVHGKQTPLPIIGQFADKLTI